MHRHPFELLLSFQPLFHACVLGGRVDALDEGFGIVFFGAVVEGFFAGVGFGLGGLRFAAFG